VSSPPWAAEPAARAAPEPPPRATRSSRASRRSRHEALQKRADREGSRTVRAARRTLDQPRRGVALRVPQTGRTIRRAPYALNCAMSWPPEAPASRQLAPHDEPSAVRAPGNAANAIGGRNSRAQSATVGTVSIEGVVNHRCDGDPHSQRGPAQPGGHRLANKTRPKGRVWIHRPHGRTRLPTWHPGRN
jgi:hypothetical protein